MCVRACVRACVRLRVCACVCVGPRAPVPYSSVSVTRPIALSTCTRAASRAWIIAPPKTDFDRSVIRPRRGDVRPLLACGATWSEAAKQTALPRLPFIALADDASSGVQKVDGRLISTAEGKSLGSRRALKLFESCLGVEAAEYVPSAGGEGGGGSSILWCAPAADGDGAHGSMRSRAPVLVLVLVTRMALASASARAARALSERELVRFNGVRGACDSLLAEASLPDGSLMLQRAHLRTESSNRAQHESAESVDRGLADVTWNAMVDDVAV